MKTFRLISAAVLLAVPATMAAGGNSAKEAIRTIAREKGSDIMTRIVNVAGSRGQDQPSVWRVVTHDPNSRGFYEYFVQSGRIISRGVVSASNAASISGHAIPQKRLKYDSTAAFSVAENAARKAKIGFDSVDFDLRCLELSDRPVWFITLLNSSGAKSGEVSVAGDNGQILRKAFFTPGMVVTAKGTKPAAPPQGYVYQPAPQPTLWNRTKDGVARSTILVKDSVVQAGGKVRGFFNRVIGKPEQPAYLYGQQQPAGQTYYYQPGR